MSREIRPDEIDEKLLRVLQIIFKAYTGPEKITTTTHYSGNYIFSSMST